MKIRLALVAAKGTVEGPWLRSRGNETGIRVRGLAEGSRICVLIEVDGVIQPSTILDSDGTWPLPDSWTRIQFSKQCDIEDGSRTHVDLLVA